MDDEEKFQDGPIREYHIIPCPGILVYYLADRSILAAAAHSSQ